MVRRRSSTSISATRPIFPNYLLPTLNFSIYRRKSTEASSATSSSPDDSPSSSAVTTPSNTPPEQSSIKERTSASTSHRLARAAPDTLKCTTCSTDIALASQIISKGFTGRYGRAFLVAPPPPPAEQSILNVRIGRSEDRQLVTGWHVVADICCATCSRKLGWKYVDAKEQSQKYKVGKYILETERVMTHRSWEDFAVEDLGLMEGEQREGAPSALTDSAGGKAGISISSTDDILFDSEDEDECEDIFAGVWDAETVAKRRSEVIARRISVID